MSSGPTAARSAASSRARPVAAAHHRRQIRSAAAGAAGVPDDRRQDDHRRLQGRSPTNPDWVHNLRANPRAHIEVGTEAYDVTARELPPEERDELFEKVTAVAPAFAEYQAKTSRVIPLFELLRA